MASLLRNVEFLKTLRLGMAFAYMPLFLVFVWELCTHRRGTLFVVHVVLLGLIIVTFGVAGLLIVRADREGA